MESPWNVALYIGLNFGGCIYIYDVNVSSGISGQSMPKGDSSPAGLLQLQEEGVFMDWSPEDLEV